MSTRAAIVRTSNEGRTFKGVYHHWDGYPSGLGATLYQLYNGTFGRNLDAMLAAVIDAHPAGYSTLNGADFSLPAGFIDQHSPKAPCAQCERPNWEHYAQYYDNADLNAEGKPCPPRLGTSYAVLDHGFTAKEEPKGPQCYCHGQRHEEANTITQSNLAGCGGEYAYAFDRKGPKKAARMLILASFHDNGHKSIGMFGQGDPDAHWQVKEVVLLDAPEPCWEFIDKLAG